MDDFMIWNGKPKSAIQVIAKINRKRKRQIQAIQRQICTKQGILIGLRVSDEGREAFRAQTHAELQDLKDALNLLQKEDKGDHYGE